MEFHDGSIEHGEKFTREELHSRTNKRKKETTSQVHKTESNSQALHQSQPKSSQNNSNAQQKQSQGREMGSLTNPKRPTNTGKNKSPLKSGALRKNLEYKNRISTNKEESPKAYPEQQSGEVKGNQLNTEEQQIPASLVQKLDEVADKNSVSPNFTEEPKIYISQSPRESTNSTIPQPNENTPTKSADTRFRLFVVAPDEDGSSKSLLFDQIFQEGNRQPKIQTDVFYSQYIDPMQRQSITTITSQPGTYYTSTQHRIYKPHQSYNEIGAPTFTQTTQPQHQQTEVVYSSYINANGETVYYQKKQQPQTTTSTRVTHPIHSHNNSYRVSTESQPAHQGNNTYTYVNSQGQNVQVRNSVTSISSDYQQQSQQRTTRVNSHPKNNQYVQYEVHKNPEQKYKHVTSHTGVHPTQPQKAEVFSQNSQNSELQAKENTQNNGQSLGKSKLSGFYLDD